jgi:hypothetical protein
MPPLMQGDLNHNPMITLTFSKVKKVLLWSVTLVSVWMLLRP